MFGRSKFCWLMVMALVLTANLVQAEETWQNMFDQAMQQAHGGQHEQAVASFDALLKKFPNDADGLLGRGRVLAWLKRYPDAEKDLQQVVKDHPDYGDAWSALADLYRWWGKTDQSLAACDAWIALEPENPAPRISRARTRMAARHFPEARNDLTDATQLGGDPAVINPLLLGLDRVPAATDWEARLWYQNEQLTDRPDANGNRIRVHLQRRLPQGSVALGYKGLDRFENKDHGVFVDFYQDLWQRAYGNFRFEIAADPLVMPKTDTFAGIYQGFSTRWEVMASGRHLVYDGQSTNIYQMGLGFFPGPWYLRLQGYIVPRDSGDGHGIITGARRYLGEVDNYAEVSVVRFKEFQALNSGPVGTGDEGWTINLHVQIWLWKNWGLGGGYVYSTPDNESPETHILRLGVSWRD